MCVSVNESRNDYRITNVSCIGVVVADVFSQLNDFAFKYRYVSVFNRWFNNWPNPFGSKCDGMNGNSKNSVYRI